MVGGSSNSSTNSSGGGGGGGSVIASGGSSSAGVASIGATSASGGAIASTLASSLIPGGHGSNLREEHSDLEELEQFARTFKQRRIKLGFTQVTAWRKDGSGHEC